MGCVVASTASEQYARIGRCQHVFTRFTILNMSSSDTPLTPPSTDHPSRAKLKRIVQDEFASNLRGEIKVATEDLKKSNKDDLKAASDDLIRQFKMIGLGASIIVSLVFVLVGFYVYQYIPVAIKTQVQDAREQIQKDLRTEIDPIRERVTRIELSSEILKNLKVAIEGDDEYVRNNASKIADTLRLAQEQGVTVDPSEVDQLGRKLIKVYQSNVETAPATWIAVNEALDYRSFLNARLFPDSYYARITTNDRRSEAFKYDHTPTTIEYQFNGILFENVTQNLDWIGFENVIFRNCIIRYSGKPTMIKNVSFQNCTFEFDPEPSSIKVSTELLASNIVSMSVQ